MGYCSSRISAWHSNVNLVYRVWILELSNLSCPVINDQYSVTTVNSKLSRRTVSLRFQSSTDFLRNLFKAKVFGLFQHTKYATSPGGTHSSFLRLIVDSVRQVELLSRSAQLNRSSCSATDRKSNLQQTCHKELVHRLLTKTLSGSIFQFRDLELFFVNMSIFTVIFSQAGRRNLQIETRHAIVSICRA